MPNRGLLPARFGMDGRQAGAQCPGSTRFNHPFFAGEHVQLCPNYGAE